MKFLAVSLNPFSNPLPNILAVHLAQDDIHAAENNHGVSDRVADTHILKDGEVDKTRRAHSITISVRGAVTDNIKAQFAFRAFNSSVRFAWFWLEITDLVLGINDRSFRNIAQRLLKNLHRLAHFQNPDHVAIEDITVITEWNAKIETIVNAIFVHLAEIVIHAAGAQHWAGDPSVNGQPRLENSNALSTGQHDFV